MTKAEALRKAQLDLLLGAGENRRKRLRGLGCGGEVRLLHRVCASLLLGAVCLDGKLAVKSPGIR